MNRHQQRASRHRGSSDRDRWGTNSTVRIRGRKYRVEGQLGHWYRPRYLATQSGSNRRCLILRLRRDDVSEQHLKVLQRLGHRHSLPSILDVQKVGGELLIVTTYQPGVDLRQYLELVKQKRVVPPSAYESVRLTRGLAHGLWQLHRYTQLIHGDLKPANLIITRKPAHLSLVDFGSAWQIEGTTQRHPGDGYEPAYAAPELIQSSRDQSSQRVDARADQFSAMVILYQLLTGVMPYEGLGGQAGLPKFKENSALTVVQVSERSLAVQRLPKRLRTQVDRLMHTGLALDPDQRFPTTSAWVDELERLFLQMKSQTSVTDPGHWQSIVDQTLKFLSVKLIRTLANWLTTERRPNKSVKIEGSDHDSTR